MESGDQCAQICSLTMHYVSHPYIVSFWFYTIPICNSQDVKFVSTHFQRIIISKKGGKLCKKLIIVENGCCWVKHVVVM